MKTPRKITAFVLIGAVATTSFAVVPASAKTFSDVPSNHWAYAVIDEMSDRRIMVGMGDNIFSPDTLLTRAQYTAILFNLAPDKGNGRFEANYSDVASDAWYADAAEWGVTNGIIETVDGKFNPDGLVSRELMADMTYKFVYYNFASQIINNSISPGYADQDSISDEYEASVNILTNNGLLAGRGDNQFVPQGTLTRAEAAAMASRLLEIVDKAGESPEDPGTPTDPETPPVDPEEPTDPETPPVDPEEPTDPEKPPVDPEEPSDPDPSDPSNWGTDGGSEWFLVGQPDSFTDEQWNELITYWADKEKPGDYPSKIPSQIKTEERAKAYFESYLQRLYGIMQRDYADQALASGTVDLSSEEEKMVELINQARLDAGLPVLVASPSLCEAASIRAKEGADLFSHTRPNGSPASSVLVDVGLTYFDMDNETNRIAYAENITYRKSSSSEFTASDAQENFMESTPHKNNLLDKNHKYIGVGCYKVGNKTVWVQSFGRLQ